MVNNSSRGAWTWALGVGFAAWWVVTAASQHPQRTFDRFRQYDPIGLAVPNWRFFAPEPAQHDFHVLHRVLTADGEQTPWRETTRIAGRTWRQLIWFPSRREEKAVFDVCTELLKGLDSAGTKLTTAPAYRLLRDLTERQVRHEYMDQPLPRGFQFVIARYTGFDEEPDPEYLLASEFVPMAGAAK